METEIRPTIGDLTVAPRRGVAGSSHGIYINVSPPDLQEVVHAIIGHATTSPTWFIAGLPSCRLLQRQYRHDEPG